MIDKERGHSLPSEKLASIIKEVDEKIETIADKLSIHDRNDSELLYRYANNPHGVGIKKELMDRIRDKNNWIRRLAKKLEANEKTIRKYIDNLELLHKESENRSTGDRKVRALSGIWRQIFREGVRLLSTPINDLIRYIPKNFPHAPRPLFNVIGRPVMEKPATGRLVMERTVSRGTYANEAILPFDLSGNMTIEQVKADKVLLEKVKKNLRDWEPGTIGVHAVQIIWQVDHGKDQSSEEWAETTLLLMAERSTDENRHIDFELFQTGATSEDKAHRVKEFIDSLSIPTKLVRLTSEMHDGMIRPTALDKSVLEEVLGDRVSVEGDEPTRGLGMIKVPGKFPMQEDFKSKLQLIRNQLYTRKKRDGKLETSRSKKAEK